jgi:hypothetical protein
MAPWSREKIGKTAQEIANHLMLVENVKALQQGQKEMADAIAALRDRIRDLEADIRGLKAETKLEAIKETQQMVNAVQGAFHERLTDLTVRVAHMEKRGNSHGAAIALPPSLSAAETEAGPST